MSLKAELVERARALGFEKVGVARVGGLERAPFYREWIAEGRHGEMSWLAEGVDRRLDPAKFLPGAKSVVCVAKNYYHDRPPATDPSRGVVSRYAWGQDYHEWLMERLRTLEGWMKERGAAARVTVDTGAVLEKPWAERAGIGWQGKHSNVLTEDLSSWVFLGVLVTDAELEADAPAEDRCGGCVSCIEACPTGAIVAPYVVDARKCISYLTIEQAGPIPRELRPKLGNLIFGCDLCQDVCPWNSHAKVAPEAEFHPREDLAAPRLVELLALTEEEFASRFKSSPLRRAKRRGFLRNVCVALGNSGDRTAIPALQRALADPEPLIRQHAAWALGRLGGRAELQARLPVERDPGVVEEIRAAMNSEV